MPIEHATRKHLYRVLILQYLSRAYVLGAVSLFRKENLGIFVIARAR